MLEIWIEVLVTLLQLYHGVSKVPALGLSDKIEMVLNGSLSWYSTSLRIWKRIYPSSNFSQFFTCKSNFIPWISPCNSNFTIIQHLQMQKVGDLFNISFVYNYVYFLFDPMWARKFSSEIFWHLVTRSFLTQDSQTHGPFLKVALLSCTFLR